ncbi:MAG: MgtC/SapB family protein [bacterium]|nr:MgtC/SapB family protein [bacterium]
MNFFDQEIVQICTRLFLAAFLGSLVGIEREIAKKPAGIRTHALVALGAALFSVVSYSVVGDTVDPTRIAAQIVTGVGFLGAGMIIFHQSRVQGLTTAAGMWIAAAIGMATGFGMYLIGIFTAVLTVLIFIVMWPIEEHFLKKISHRDHPHNV